MGAHSEPVRLACRATSPLELGEGGFRGEGEGDLHQEGTHKRDVNQENPCSKGICIEGGTACRVNGLQRQGT